MVLIASFTLPKPKEDPKDREERLERQKSPLYQNLRRARKLRKIMKEEEREKRRQLRVKDHRLKRQQDVAERRQRQSYDEEIKEALNENAKQDIGKVVNRKRKADEASTSTSTPPKKVQKVDELVACSVQKSKEAGELIREIDDFLNETHRLVNPNQGPEAAPLSIDDHMISKPSPNTSNNCYGVQHQEEAPAAPSVRRSKRRASQLVEPSYKPKKKRFSSVPTSFH